MGVSTLWRKSPDLRKIKMNYRLKLALGCILAVSASASSYGATLVDVYQRALQSDPSLREADATRLATREGKPQAWAALLPQVDGSASATRAKTTSDGSPRVVDIDPVTGAFIVATGISDATTDTKRWSVQLRQTIFRWDQWAALKRADAQNAQAEANYKAAEQDLLVRVSQRYFNVLAAKDTLDASDATAEAFSRQLEQSEKRFEVGLIAITDVQEARAARDQAVADVIGAKRVLATNQELLREITGEAFDSLAAPQDDMPLKNPEPASEDRWVSAAMEQNLALIATRLNADIASANVSVARAGHLPTVDLVASRGKTDIDTDTGTQLNTGVRNTSNFNNATTDSISLQLYVPIFSSGATQSRVRQAVYTQRAAREHVDRISRETERAARDNYLGVVSNISRVQALKQALESSRTALQATEAGFEVGTRTTVDVLLSRRTLFTAQTQYSRSRYDYILSIIQLKQAAGTLAAQDIMEINGWLK